MVRYFLLAVLLLAVRAPAQDEWRPYKCRPLSFEIAIPAGWKADQDKTGMVAQSADAGFRISREPFLHTPKGFAAAWAKELEAGGIKTKVTATKARGYVAYRAAWTATKAGRSIEVWRVHVPVNEMLYNFSFSAKDAAQLKPLVEEALRQFKVTAKPPKMKFQSKKLSLAARVSIGAPEGYVAAERGVKLGGGLSRGFTRTLPGFQKPHVAGQIAARAMGRAQTKKVVAAAWEQDSPKYGKVLKRPRTKSAKYNDIKGHSVVATVLTKAGLPKRYMVFAGKVGQLFVQVTVVVDEREARMYGDYLKLVCSQITRE